MNVVDMSSKELVSFIIGDTSRLLSNLNLSKDNPMVNIHEVAERLGLQIEENPLVKHVHAVMNENTIMLRPDDNPEQKRFSIAHEIAHIRTNGKISVRLDDGSQVTVYYDQNAQVARQMDLSRRMNELPQVHRKGVNLVEEALDYYAASLLLPSHLFSMLMGQSNEDIARLCSVPVACVQKRREEIRSELNILDTEESIDIDFSDPLSTDEALDFSGRM